MNIKRFLCVVLVTAIVTALIPEIGEVNATAKNLALGMPVEASQPSYGPDTNESMSVDGNIGTKWAPRGTANQWAIIDFQKDVPFNKIVMTTGDKGRVPIKYVWQYSDDKTNWTDIPGTQENNQKGFEVPTPVTFKFDSITARYLKLKVSEAVAFGMYIHEIEVYDTLGLAALTKEERKSITDIKGTPFEKAINVLLALNILNGYKDRTIRPYNTITRAEFTDVLVKTLGFDEASNIKPDYNLFFDLPASYWAAGSVNLATKMGIIMGFDNGMFAPEEPVTYEQALKMIVCALGYKMPANANGGYPNGYLTIAFEKKLNKNFEGVIGVPLKRGEVAQLIFNSLSVDKLEQSAYGNNQNYLVTNGKTILTENLKVIKSKGVVDATNETGLTGNSNIKDDEVNIDGVTYKVGKTRAKQFLGYNAEFYSKEENDVKTLIFIDSDISDNAVKVIDADDVSADSTLLLLKYWNDLKDNRKIETEVIAEDAKFIYNGKANSNITASQLKPSTGNLTLIDNNNDGKADVVLVYSFETYVVNYVNAIEDIIYCKDGNPSIKLYPNEKNKTVKVIKDGVGTTLKDLKEWDVIKVAANKKDINNSDYVYIDASSNTVSGKITEISTDKIFIDNKEYKVAKEFDSTTFKVGVDSIFYITSDGKIAYGRKLSNKLEEYGYLLNAALNSGILSNARIKFVDVDSSVKIFDTTNKIIFNDGTGSDSQKLDASIVIGKLKLNGSVARQLITYEIDKDGFLNKLSLANDMSKTSDYIGFSDGGFTKNTVYTSNERYNAGQLGSYFLDKTTKVFTIPGDETTADDSDYRVGNMYDLASGIDYQNLEIYDATSDMRANVILYRQITSDISAYDREVVLVDSVSKSINANGLAVYKVNGIYNGAMTSWFTIDGNVKNEQSEGIYIGVKVEQLSRGDIIKIRLNFRKDIQGISVLYVAKAPPLSFKENGSTNVATIQYYYLYGMVDRCITDGIIVNIGTSRRTFSFLGANVYIIDSEANRIEVGSVSDIAVSDKVYINATYMAPKEIIIIR